MMIIVRDIYGAVEATLEQLRTIIASANDPRTIFWWYRKDCLELFSALILILAFKFTSVVLREGDHESMTGKHKHTEL